MKPVKVAAADDDDDDYEDYDEEVEEEEEEEEVKPSCGCQQQQQTNYERLCRGEEIQVSIPALCVVVCYLLLHAFCVLNFTHSDSHEIY